MLMYLIGTLSVDHPNIAIMLGQYIGFVPDAFQI